MPETRTIALSVIAVHPGRLRALRPDTVNALAQSMAEQGQLQPIVVRRRKDRSYWLVAGLHRVKAAAKLKWQEINCTVVDHMEADEAELAEIDENLVRANLTPAEEAMHLGRRQELYEKVHGKAKAKGARAANKKMGKGKSDDANDKLSFAFTEDTAKKTGETKRNVQRKTARSKKVAVLAEIVGTSLDKGSEIDALAKLPEAEQHSLAEAAKRGEPVSAVTALSAVPEAPKTSDGTGKEADRAPTLDPRAWPMATAQERKAFVKEVGRAEIEDAFNAIESVNTLTRGLNALNQAWNAATESDLQAFYRQNFPANVMNRFQT